MFPAYGVRIHTDINTGAPLFVVSLPETTLDAVKAVEARFPGMTCSGWGEADVRLSPAGYRASANVIPKRFKTPDEARAFIADRGLTCITRKVRTETGEAAWIIA